MTALIIDAPWIDHILSGKKSWEMRSQATSKRGRIGLIRKGSGTIAGEATLVDSLTPLTRAEMLETIDKHQIPVELLLTGGVDKWRYPWVLEDVERYPTPVRYDHPNGAVIWVALGGSENSAPSVVEPKREVSSSLTASRATDPDSAAVVQLAERLAARHLRSTGTPTKYFAGFENKRGQQLAIERNKQTLFLWIETLSTDRAGLAVRNQKKPGQPYAANQSRNSNLRSRAPRLAEGHEAFYVAVDDIATFDRLLTWYAA
jgi:hypothetical protein